MSAKRTSGSSRKINDFSTPKANPTSRPIIVNNPRASDPMVNAIETEEDGSFLSVHGRRVEPPKPPTEEESGHSEPGGSDVSGASPSDIIEKVKSERTSDESKPAKANEAPAESNQPGHDESSDDDGSDDNEVEQKPKTEADKEAEKQAQQIAAERVAKYDELTLSEKYFVPIGAVRRRHNLKWLIGLIIVLALIVILDLLFDAGVLKANGFNFHTNFFSQELNKRPSAPVKSKENSQTEASAKPLNQEAKPESQETRTAESRQKLASNIKSAGAGECKSDWSVNNKSFSDLMQSDAVPAGIPVASGGSAVEVTKVVSNPHTDGAQPDSGTQYLEIDLSITGQPVSPNSFLYNPSKPPMCFIETVGPVDGNQKYFNPITNQLLPAKDVTVPGKTSLFASGSKTVSGNTYLLVEVQPGDTGYMLWLDPNQGSHAFIPY